MAASDSDIQWQFHLTSGSTQTEIIEPENWLTFKSSFVRDMDAHGVFYRFTANNMRLGFVGAGRTILENAWQVDGFDAVVTFRAQKRQDEFADWETIFNGTAVFRNRELNIEYFKCDFEDQSFIEKIKNRFDTTVNIGATETLDGEVISTEITQYGGSWNKLLASSEFAANYKSGASPTTSTNIDTDNQADTTDVTRRWWPEFVDDTITEHGTKQDANENTEWEAAIPLHTDEFFDFDAAGDITFSPTVQ